MKTPSTLMITVTLLLTTSCVGVLPVPPLSSEVHEGRKIERREVGFIVPGVTT